ncbi:hypothetical protein ASPZODRAFT_14390 [Penicilliopsis zonata CBS 506.65]|uniref:Uncharacterized protein n=1 Tax=Penicilliopsis zonata CBS 506.65 TaxID=1073090 RepID=A0A1L9SLS8_9EURO|nr:hypothetical protein ASPZODRAFT_14390 [Penicilliopsis zonata CBS 506.65]OJJ48242.1 hypothetical protein ASPZODRAFT_14390 [Penicilliopsis zonata CBS 506.65]
MGFTFTNDRLRRSKSTRSFRGSRHSSSTPQEAFDPELAKVQATAAASYAMRRSGERSSMDSNSRGSYNRLGGPGNMAVPRRSHHNSSDASSTADQISLSDTVYPSRHPSSQYRGSHESYCQSDTATLPPISEFQGLDGRLAEEPSSYRRLRKTKSMFSTKRYSSEPGDGSFPPDSNGYIGSRKKSYGTLRRSMSFLRGGVNQPEQNIRHAKSHDLAIEMARNQFHHDHQDPSPVEHSMMTAKQSRDQYRPFRKTFRVTSAPALDAPTGTPSSLEQQVNSKTLHGKARSFSLSFKNGIRRVFGLSRTNHGSSSPSSSSSPWRNRASTEHHQSPGQTNTVILDTPELHSVSSSETLRTSTSRVTSWADSTAANTVVSSRRPADRNSLSIIEEHGNLNASPLNIRPELFRQNGSVDSQRVYSALMKRINQAALENEDGEISFGTVKEHRPIPERASSIYSHRSKRTVRRVPSSESVASIRSFATASLHAPGMLGSSYNPSFSKAPKQQQSQQQREFVGMAMGSTATLDSASVYSRTTGGHSPVDNSNSNNGETGSDQEASEELGMATIFESQRQPYSSPRRRAADTAYSAKPVQPSGNWQQWVSSQMARIEQVTPVRAHYREDSQVNGDTEKIVPSLSFSAVEGTITEHQEPTASPRSPGSTTTPPPKVAAAAGADNFSRPLTRSSSVRTIVPSMALRRSPSALSVMGYPSSSLALPSPMQVRSSNVVRIPESPTPKREGTLLDMRKQMGERDRRSSLRYPTGPQDVKAVPFRSIRGNRGGRQPMNENMKVQDEYGDDPMQDYTKLEELPSTISSKRMVEIFLSSRRRQMGGRMSEESQEAFV